MPYGFNDNKSKFDLTAFQKKATGTVKTSKNGWFNLADLGLKPDTQVPICVIVTSSSYPDGIFARTTISASDYWSQVHDKNNAIIGNQTMSATVYYMDVI